MAKWSVSWVGHDHVIEAPGDKKPEGDELWKLMTEQKGIIGTDHKVTVIPYSEPTNDDGEPIIGGDPAGQTEAAQDGIVTENKPGRRPKRPKAE